MSVPKVYDIIKQYDGPISLPEIHALDETISKENIARALWVLNNTGRVRRTKILGKPYTYTVPDAARKAEPTKPALTERRTAFSSLVNKAEAIVSQSAQRSWTPAEMRKALPEIGAHMESYLMGCLAKRGVVRRSTAQHGVYVVNEGAFTPVPQSAVVLDTRMPEMDDVMIRFAFTQLRVVWTSRGETLKLKILDALE